MGEENHIFDQTSDVFPFCIIQYTLHFKWRIATSAWVYIAVRGEKKSVRSVVCKSF